MKKSVIILIGIIYAAAITLVTFYGLETADYIPEKIPVSKIEITNSNLRINAETGEKYVSLLPDANGERKFKVEYTIAPGNATTQAVKFILGAAPGEDEENFNGYDYATVDDTGLVTFGNITRPSSAWLYVYTTDGTRLFDAIEITFMR